MGMQLNFLCRMVAKQIDGMGPGCIVVNLDSSDDLKKPNERPPAPAKRSITLGMPPLFMRSSFFNLALDIWGDTSPIKRSCCDMVARR